MLQVHSSPTNNALINSIDINNISTNNISINNAFTNNVATNKNATAFNHSLTEIVLAESQHESYEIILPMLAHLSQQEKDRWFTWITPQGALHGIDIQSYGFAKERVRIIHTRSDEESLWVLWEALSNSNSATVVAKLSHFGEYHLEEHHWQELEQAAALGNTRGLVLRYR